MEKVFDTSFPTEYVSTGAEVIRLLRQARNIDFDAFARGPRGKGTLKSLLEEFFERHLWFLLNLQTLELATARRSLGLMLSTEDGWQLYATKKAYADGRIVRVPREKRLLVIRETIIEGERPRYAGLRGACEEAGFVLDAEWIHIGIEDRVPQAPELSSVFPGMLSYRFLIHGEILLKKRPRDWPPTLHDEAVDTHTSWQMFWADES
jgi:hypothetical protein